GGTGSGDARRPAMESAQNGVASRSTSPRPVRPHTHRRFATYDGPMPHSTATTLAGPAGTPAPDANATRTAALSRVVPTETTKQRVIRATTARCTFTRSTTVIA